MTAASFSLTDLGWDDTWQEAAAAHAESGVPGRVARVDRGLCSVLTAGGPVRASLGARVLEAMVADTISAPCTGDWCLVRQWPDGPLTVELMLPRRTSVTRAEASGTSRGQVLASNITHAAVVVALHPEPKLVRVERLLALAWASGAVPLVVLTKTDLVSDADELAEDVSALAGDAEVICTSTVTGAGLQRVRELVGTGTVALLGASGHGKSSLTNALLGADAILTRRIRDDGKGRHTSVRRELVLLPGGGSVIDTPGLRSVGLQDTSLGLEQAFPDITAIAAHCRFADCAHDEEPGCAVREAIERGDLPTRRLVSWHKLRREQTAMADRSITRLRKRPQHPRR